MGTKVYNTMPIQKLMEEWYTPEEITRTIDDVLFYYSITKMEEGNISKRDIDIVTILRSLKKSFEQI